jgi:hypothetical protein
MIHLRQGDDDDDKGCGCGCSGDRKPKPMMGIMGALASLGKSIDEEMQTKAGRVISNRNMQKLQQAMELLQQVVAASAPSDEPVVQVKSDGVSTQMRISVPVSELFEVKSFIDPVLDFHRIDSNVNETGIYLDANLTAEGKSAILNAMNAYKEMCDNKTTKE